MSSKRKLKQKLCQRYQFLSKCNETIPVQTEQSHYSCFSCCQLLLLYCKCSYFLLYNCRYYDVYGDTAQPEEVCEEPRKMNRQLEQEIIEYNRSVYTVLPSREWKECMEQVSLSIRNDCLLREEQASESVKWAITR